MIQKLLRLIVPHKFGFPLKYIAMLCTPGLYRLFAVCSGVQSAVAGTHFF